MIRALPAMLGSPMGDQDKGLAIRCPTVQMGIGGRQIVKLMLGSPGADHKLDRFPKTQVQRVRLEGCQMGCHAWRFDQAAQRKVGARRRLQRAVYPAS